MLFVNFERLYIIHEYNSYSGEVESTLDIDRDDSKTWSQIRGCCKETPKGWAAVYREGENLYFQINSQKWNLGDDTTKLSYSTLDGAYFIIKNKEHSFEIKYRYWMVDALMSDLDDPDSDHDFFAYVLWLCEPENYHRVAKKWAKTAESTQSE